MTTLPKNIPAAIRAKAQQPQVDLTPMLDVVFILLIFFVVTAIQFEGWSIPLENMPPAPPQPFQENQPQNILIDIHEDGRIVFNGDVIDIGAVRAHTLSVLAENPQASMIVRPARNSIANLLVQVIDNGKIAGISNIQIAD